MKKQHKKEFVCEQDRIMAAFAKVNLREAVDPIVRGKIVEDEETYNKVQQLLDCPDMEHAHQFLLDVDFEDLTPEVKQKIDDLYQLAISQGYLTSDEPAATDEEPGNNFPTEGAGEQPQISDMSSGFENDNPNPALASMKDPTQVAQTNLATCAFTLFYSAMKDGEIKTGECYSNATTLENAKLDAVQKLQRLGFTAVEIIAAEECDPNAKGCDEKQPEEFGEPLNDVSEPETDAVTDAAEETPADDMESADDSSDEEESEEEDDSDEDEEDEPVDEAEEEKADNEKDNEEDKEEEEPEEEEPDDGEELSRSEKLDLFKRYLEEFKGLLQKMKAETYADMALADRAKFYDEMSKIWDGKPDPSQFMTDDNVKQIEHMKIKIAK